MNAAWVPVAALTVASALLGYVLAGPPAASETIEAPAGEPIGAVVEPAPAAPSPTTAADPPATAVAQPTASPPRPASDPTPRTSRTLSLPQPVSVAPFPAPDEDEDEEAEATPHPNDPPGGMTAEALSEQDMSALSPNDEDYDEIVEAHQRFHAWEQEILEHDELTPEVWAELQQKYAADTQAVVDRAAELNLDGHPAEAESLLVEWDSLESRYRKRVK